MHSSQFKVRLGLFVAGGFILFAFAIFLIGRQKNLFNPVFKLTTSFSNVSGLQVGNNIRFSGVNVGTVDNLELNGSEIVRTNETLTGTLETNEIDLGATFTSDFASLAAQYFNPTLSTVSVLGRVDYNADPAADTVTDKKTVFDFEMQYGTVSGALSGWHKFEYHKLFTVDGSGNGNAEDAYTIGAGVRVQVRYVKIRIGIRNV